MVEEPHTQPGVTTPAQSDLAKQEPEPEWVDWLKEHCVPICGILLMLLALSLVSHFRAGTGWSKARDITDTLAKVVQTLAIIVAGGWGYFKFIKGRTYQERLIPTVSGKLLTIDSQTYLIANIRVENVGHSVVQFAPDASTLRILGHMNSTSSKVMTLEDIKLAQFVALNNMSIEPNEIIQRTMFMSIPMEVRFGLRLELEIISNHRKQYGWLASFVVEKSTSSAIIDSGNEV
ncbi:MAG TPA: hypothetical protein VF290_27195 [Pyrinomonadaceae bacterium]